MHRLHAEPWKFDFFQAVRRLECAHPDRPGVGRSQRASQDPVRFTQTPSLAFAPATLGKVTAGENGAPPRIAVNFFGLLGPNGPMPLHLTEYAHERILHHDDPTLARFLDVFQHRMVSLFYRAWASVRPTVNQDRGEDDRFAIYIASLFGLGSDALRRRDAVDDLAKLYYSGHLVTQTRHAAGLEALLGDYLDLKVRIEQFRGQWVRLPDDCLCRAGDPNTGVLGRTTIVGSRVWDCQSRFRIRVGPMPLRDYERLLPGGQSFTRVRDWVRNYAGDVLSWDLQLVLAADEVPDTRLGGGARLGWTTWMKSGPYPRDADNLVLEPTAA